MKLIMKQDTRCLFKKIGLCLASFGGLVLSASAQQTDSTRVAHLRDSLRTVLKTSHPFQLPDKDVSVLFGNQKKGQLLQSYGIVGGEELESFPAAELMSSLYGKLAGLYLVQTSSEPGSDKPSLLLRGRNPLVIIDGVPRSFTSIDPEQIASVSVIKDALGTAIYGMRAADGVLLIQTKRGANAPRKISFTSQYALQEQIKTPKFLNSYDYATLFNEALANDGKQAVYSTADLEKYRTGSSPFTHPNEDWYKRILNNTAAMQRYNINIAGGTSSTRYFVDLDYLNQQGFFNVDNNLNTYPTNNYFKRYTFRSNIDVDLTKSTFLSVNLFGRIRNGNEPGASTSAVYNGLLSTPNNAYPVFNADGSLGGNSQYPNNLYGQALRSGYLPSSNRNLGVDVSIKQNLGAIVKGLYVKGLVSLNTYYDEQIDRSKTFSVYNLKTDPVTNKTYYQKIGNDGTQSNSSSISGQNRQIYSQFDLGYDQIFGKNTLNSLLLYSRDSYVSGSDLSLVNQALSGRVQYSYDGKYLAEAAASYMGVDRYRPGHQWGIFPAVGLGWNLSSEDWFKAAGTKISQLKIRASYGLTGSNSNAGYFIYNQFYSSGNSFYSKNPATSSSTINESALADPNLSWEKARKYNVGTDISLFKDQLWFSADYYSNFYYDQLQDRGTNGSAIIGNTLPQQNIGKRRYNGLELAAGFQSKINDFKYFISGNVNWGSSKLIFIDEPNRRNAYEQRTGLPVGQVFGYVADGLYNSAAEIQSGPKVEGYNPIPGDIRYKDLNHDGVINIFDQTALGSTKPLLFYGLTAGFNYKGLDFSLTINGVQNRSVLLMGNNTFEFQQNATGGYGQAMEHHLDRWTPATAATATYPRLSLGVNTNNQAVSSYWMKNGSYLRVKNVEVGYSLPVTWVKTIGLAGIRVFANGLNLLTFTDLERVDPEAISWGYPNQRVFNFGANLKF
jgi:TonB-linked SusC/RagA family outer membrane protein